MKMPVPGVAQLSLGLAAGLLASPHCAGMCGAFPLHLSRGGGRARLLLYVVGKTVTYVFLGVLAGAFGEMLVRSRAVSLSQHFLAYGLGALLVILGVAMLDLFRLPSLPTRALQGWAPVQQACRQLAGSPGPVAAGLLGVATGFLPCPVTLAMLAAAAAAHSPLGGAAALFGLGVGTAPALLVVGFSGALFTTRVRRVGLRGAGLILLALGAITMLRPSGLLCRVLPTFGGPPHACCAHDGR